MGNKETKRERFTRIAEARTNKIIDMIELLGNCSNRATYEYSKEDVKKIFNAIESELRLAKAKFDIGDSDGKEKKFSLR
jgi:hypothetical protein